MVDGARKALKVVPYHKLSLTELVMTQMVLNGYRNENSNYHEMEDGDFVVSQLSHENIIAYQNILLDFVHDVFMFVFGMCLSFYDVL